MSAATVGSNELLLPAAPCGMATCRRRGSWPVHHPGRVPQTRRCRGRVDVAATTQGSRPTPVACAGYLAWAEVCHSVGRLRFRELSWLIGVLNLLGSVCFGVSAIGAFENPDTGDVTNRRWDNG